MSLKRTRSFYLSAFKTGAKTVIYHYAPRSMLVVFRPDPDTAQCELVLTLLKLYRSEFFIA